MTSYSAFRNYFNFQVSDLAFRFSFQKNMYAFTRFFTGPNTTESSSKLLKQSPVRICSGPAALLKKDSSAFVSCTFREIFQNTCFKEYPCKSAPKVISQQLCFFWIVLTQLTFPYSKSTTEALEKSVKMLKDNNKNTRETSLTSFWCFQC